MCYVVREIGDNNGTAARMAELSFRSGALAAPYGANPPEADSGHSLQQEATSGRRNSAQLGHYTY